MRYLFLFVFFTFTHFYCLAQNNRPKWLDHLGGGVSALCGVTDLAVDKQNNIYITGRFKGTVDFDPSAGIKNLTSTVGGGQDMFVGKYTPDGALIWVVSMGDDGSSPIAYQTPNSIALDRDGNISVTGQYVASSLDADPGSGIDSLYNIGEANGFLIHLDNNGSFLWAQYIGSFGTQGGTKVASDSQDNVIVTANFGKTVTIGDSTYTAPGNANYGLILKYGPGGNLLWNVCLRNTGLGYEGVFGGGVDSQDNIVVSGAFSHTINFNPLGSAVNLTGNYGAPFVAKYSPSGTLLWSNGINYTGSNPFNLSQVGIDQQNNIYFVQQYQDSISFNGSVTFHAKGNEDICFAKYSPAGALVFVKSIGGPDASIANTDVISDANNNIYLAGDFISTINFNPNAGSTANISDHGQQDFYVAKYDENGNYIYAFNGGSAVCGGTVGFGLAIDNNNNMDLAGQFCSTVDFGPNDCSADNLTAASNLFDGFVVQYGVDSSAVIANNVITAPTVSSFCGSGAPAAITGSLPTGGSGTYTYQWQSSADSVNFAAVTGATAQNYTPPTLSTTIYFERTVSSGTCTTPLVSNVVTLTVISALAAPEVPGVTVCSGSTATLSVTSPPQGITYNWYASVTSDTLLYTGVSFTTTVLTATTTYYVTAANSTGCVSATPTAATVTVNPSTVIANNVITAPTVSSFCTSGTPGAITGSLPTGGSGTYTYQWQSSTDSVNFANITGATAPNYTPTTLPVTTYFQLITSSGSCSVPLTSNIVAITVTPIPAAPEVPGVTSCAGSTTTLSITSPQQGITYNWYASATSDTLLYSGLSFTTPVLTAGTTYYVSASSGAGCNSASSTAVAVTVLPVLAAPVVTVASTTASAITFEWTAVPGATGYQVSTDNGQTYSAPTSGTAGLTDTISGLQPGQGVSIMVQVTGSIACQLSAASTAITGLAISPTDDVIYVPNAFTPNGDGINDQVHVHSENIKTLNFNIYDQWGELLFTSTNIQNGWNGTYRGTKEPVGVYVYYLQAVMNDGDIINLKGSITLLK